MIALVEEYFRHLLMKAQAVSNPALSDSKKEKFLARLKRANFGTLLQWVCTDLKLSSEALAILKEARSFRDNLAHHFWYPHFPLLVTKRGAKVLAEELELMENHFVGLLSWLEAETGESLQQLIEFLKSRANDVERIEGFEDLIERLRNTQKSHGIGMFR